MFTQSMTKPFDFSKFKDENKLNGTTLREKDNEHMKVWDTIKEKIDLLIENNRQEHEVADKDRKSILAEFKDLLSGSTNSLSTKLMSVKTITENAIQGLINIKF